MACRRSYTVFSSCIAERRLCNVDILFRDCGTRRLDVFHEFIVVVGFGLLHWRMPVCVHALPALHEDPKQVMAEMADLTAEEGWNVNPKAKLSVLWFIGKARSLQQGRQLW